MTGAPPTSGVLRSIDKGRNPSGCATSTSAKESTAQSRNSNSGMNCVEYFSPAARITEKSGT